MAFIFVNKSRLRTFAEQSRQINSKIKNINNDFLNIGRSLDWDIRAASDINSTISQINSELDKYIRTFNKISAFIETAYSEYTKLDSESMNYVDGSTPATEITTKNKNIINDILSWFNFKKDGLAILKETPVIGNLLKFFGRGLITSAQGSSSYADRSSNIGNCMEFAKDGVGAIKDIYNIVKAGGLVGAANLATQTSLTSWQVLKDKIKEPFQALKVGGAKTALARAGLVFSFGSNFAENFYEMETNGKKLSKTRAWEETILETGLDFAKAALVGAAVVGVVASLPVSGTVAVGATTLALTAGGNWGMDAITRKVRKDPKMDLTEFISDRILDKIDEQVNCTKKPVQSPEAAWANI